MREQFMVREKWEAKMVTAKEKGDFEGIMAVQAVLDRDDLISITQVREGATIWCGSWVYEEDVLEEQTPSEEGNQITIDEPMEEQNPSEEDDFEAVTIEEVATELTESGYTPSDGMDLVAEEMEKFEDKASVAIEIRTWVEILSEEGEQVSRANLEDSIINHRAGNGWQFIGAMMMVAEMDNFQDVWDWAMITEKQDLFWWVDDNTGQKFESREAYNIHHEGWDDGMDDEIEGDAFGYYEEHGLATQERR